MEPDNQHLADEYVQEFVLDHLEHVVKREDRCQMIEAEACLQHDDSSSAMCSSQWEDRRMPSPPPETMYALPPFLVNMSLMNDPGTPPNTPPNHLLLSYRHRPLDMDDFGWQSTRTEVQPLDLRPLHSIGGDPDWERKEYIPSGLIMEADNYHILQQRPQSVCSVSSALSPRMNNHHSGYSTCSDIDLNDDLLVSIPVKELNKRLHGSPREKIEHTKRTRRRLKNRVYAQNCRFKKMQATEDLEQTNRSLAQELQRTKSELARVLQERDSLLQRLGRSLSVDSGLNSEEQSSLEFCL